MEALRARFVERAAADATALRGAWAQGDMESIRRIAHSLAGNAGMFGQPQLSEAAGALEDALATPPSEDRVRRKLDAVLALIPGNSAA